MVALVPLVTGWVALVLVCMWLFGASSQRVVFLVRRFIFDYTLAWVVERLKGKTSKSQDASGTTTTTTASTTTSSSDSSSRPPSLLSSSFSSSFSSFSLESTSASDIEIELGIAAPSPRLSRAGDHDEEDLTDDEINELEDKVRDIGYLYNVKVTARPFGVWCRAIFVTLFFLSIFIAVFVINNVDYCETGKGQCLSILDVFLKILNMAGLLFAPLLFSLFRLPSRFLLCYINDIIMIGLFWLPIEFDLYPRDKAANLQLAEEVQFALVEFLVVNEALFVFLVMRPMKRGLKYSFLPLATDIKSWFRAIVALILFIIIGLPIGIVTEFIAWDPTSDTVVNFVLELIGIYFFVAIVEEFLFRSVIQNLIEEILDAFFARVFSPSTVFVPQGSTTVRGTGQSITKGGGAESLAATASSVVSPSSGLDKEDHTRIIRIDSFDQEPPIVASRKRKVIGSDGTVESTERATKCEEAFSSFYRFVYIPRNAILALVIASVIFGAAHLDNDTTNYHVPNFMYMLMATIAGLMYGWTWRASGNIVFSAITHALVDWIWVTCFSG